MKTHKTVQESSYFLKLDDGTEALYQNISDTRNSTQKLSFAEAKLYCENLDLAGFDDWELPTRLELESLASSFYGLDSGEDKKYEQSWVSWYFDNIETKINDSFIHQFFKSDRDSYWSSEVDSSDSDYIYGVNFYNGYTHFLHRDLKQNVKCIKRDFSFENYKAIE